MQGIFQKENTDKALKYGIYRHLPTYEKIIRNLVSFFTKNLAIIQLGNVNNDMTMIVPSLISSVIFRRQLEKKQGEEIKSIINIVLD
ncbi:hypothetical protein DW760_09930 [Coprobacillus sp. AM29-13]|nr:hypothetical protein DWX48_09860 [Coprobacillus sp. AF19-3]RHT51228.1 hypothetical protein DW760_09930 [Coprobacillus sp. AM29-13]